MKKIAFTLLLCTSFAGAIGVLVTQAASQNISFAGRTYYVDPNGSDNNNGSKSSPWKSVVFATSRAKKGDTIHMNRGTFVETRTIDLPPGVNLEGESSETTVLIAKNLSGDRTLIRLDSNRELGNQRLRRFSIDGHNNSLERGISITNRHNVKIDDIHLKNIKFTCLFVGGVDNRQKEGTTPPSIWVKGISVTNTQITNCGENKGGWSSGALMIAALDGARFDNITINNPKFGHGIKQFKGGWFRNIKITNSTINVADKGSHNRRAISIELWNTFNDSEVYKVKTNNWFSFGYGNKGSGKRSVKVHENQIIQSDTGGEYLAIEAAASDMEIYNNYIKNPGSYGIAIWERGSPSNNLVHHNVVVSGNNRHGFIVLKPADRQYIKTTKIYNNTLIGFKTSAINLSNTQGVVDGLDIRNNVFTDSGYIMMGGDTKTLKNVTFSNNLLYNPRVKLTGVWTNWGATKPTNFIIINNKAGNPGFNNSGPIPRPFYAPSRKSILLDAGVNVGLPFTGSAPNIGAL